MAEEDEPTVLETILEHATLVDEIPEDCVVVCGPIETRDSFPDNVVTTCNDCGVEVVHRPYIPEKSVKVCMSCVFDRAKGGTA